MKKTLLFLALWLSGQTLIASTWESAIAENNILRFESIIKSKPIDWKKESVLARYLGATTNPQASTVAYLLGSGAQATEKNEDGIPAVILGAYNAGPEVLSLLKKAGADLNIRLEMPKRGNNYPWISGIRRNFSFNKNGKRHESYDLGALNPLLYAITNNNDKAVEYLVKAGADISTPIPSSSSTSITLLEIACGILYGDKPDDQFTAGESGLGSLKAFRCAYILYKASGQKINDPSFYQSYFGAFFQPGTKSLEETLGKLGPDPENLWVWTAYAAATGDSSILAVVLKARNMGFSDFSMPESGDLNGTTILGFSLSREWYDLVKELLNRGAKVPDTIKLPRDYRLMYPLYWAADQNRMDVVELLLKAGQDPRQPSKIPFLENALFAPGASLGIRQLFLDHGVAIDQGNLKNRTLFQEACRLGNRDLARWCVEKGANPRKQTKNFVSPLHLAAASGNLDLVKDLLSLGLPPNPKATALLDDVDFAGEDFFDSDMDSAFKRQQTYTPKEVALKISKLNSMEYLAPRLKAVASFLEESEGGYEAERAKSIPGVVLAFGPETSASLSQFPSAKLWGNKTLEKSLCSDAQKLKIRSLMLKPFWELWAWGGTFYKEVYERALEETEKTFVSLGAWGEEIPSNMLAVGFKNEELYFIMGYLAATQSQTGTVCLIYPMEPSWSNLYESEDDAIEAFELGVQAYNSDYKGKIFPAKSSFSKEDERNLLNQGADVIVPINSPFLSNAVTSGVKAGLTVMGMGFNWTEIAGTSFVFSLGVDKEKVMEWTLNQLKNNTKAIGHSHLIGFKENIFQPLGTNAPSGIINSWKKLMDDINNEKLKLPGDAYKDLDGTVIFP